MTESQPAPSLLSGRTAWARNLETPLRQFLRTETGSAAILLAATVAALIWANVGAGSYESLWSTRLSVNLGSTDLSDTLHGWVNSGLMTFFFLVVGLEARREFDMGELRERRRLTLPLLIGLGGMIVPIGIYLAANAGGPGAQGWGASMSTDTAFALGMLALVGSWLPDRVRTYLLTFSVVDDLVGLGVIAIVYSENLQLPAAVHGSRHAGAVAVVRAASVRFGPVYFLLGVAAWVAFFKSGVDPVVVGLIMGLLTYATPAARDDLERASDLFRLFREQPTPELAREASGSVRLAISPNERLQQLYHPWSSYLIVPLFALANAGVVINTGLLSPGLHVPGHARHPDRLRGGQAAGHDRVRVARHQAQPGPHPAAGRLGRRRGRGRDRRDRLHRRPAHRLARLPRHPAGRGEARHPVRGVLRVRAHLDGVPGHPAAAQAAEGTRPARHVHAHHRPGRPGQPGPRSHPRAGAGAGHRGGVRRLRVPLLRAGRAGRPGTAGRLRRRPLRVPAPAR